MKKRILALFTVVSLVLTLVPFVAFAAPITVEVSNFDQLKNAIYNWDADDESNPVIIVIKDDIQISDQIDTNWGALKNKIIVSEGDKTISRAEGYNGAMFQFRGSPSGVYQIGGIDDPKYGVLTIDNSNSTGTATSQVFTLAENSTLILSGCVIKNSYTNNDTSAVRAWGSNINVIVNEGTVFENNSCSEGASCILARGGTKVTINGGTFKNNKNTLLLSSDTGSSITINDGTFTNNTTTQNYFVAIATVNDQTTFTMNGGTIDGATATAYSCLISIAGAANAYFYGGVIKNSSSPVIRTRTWNNDNIPNIVLDSKPDVNNGKGVTIKDCGNVINPLEGANGEGGAIVVFAEGSTPGGVVTMKAGTISNCAGTYGGGAITLSPADSVFNFEGGSISGCRDSWGNKNAIVGKGIINMKGTPRLDPDSYIDRTYHNGTAWVFNPINITGPVTTHGAAATITASNLGSFADGAQVLTGDAEFVAQAAEKFYIIANVWDRNADCTLDSLGKVAYGSTPPAFLDEPGETEDTITLGIDGSDVSVSANYDVGAAKLIVASYTEVDGKPKLVDVEMFDISIARDVPVDESLKAGFDFGDNVKVMLWDSLDLISPLVECLAR